MHIEHTSHTEDEITLAVSLKRDEAARLERILGKYLSGGFEQEAAAKKARDDAEAAAKKAHTEKVDAILRAGAIPHRFMAGIADPTPRVDWREPARLDELAAFARASAPLRRGSLVRFRPRLGDYTHSATPGMLARLTKPYTPGDRYVYVEWQDGTTQHPGGYRPVDFEPFDVFSPGDRVKVTLLGGRTKAGTVVRRYPSEVTVRWDSPASPSLPTATVAYSRVSALMASDDVDDAPEPVTACGYPECRICKRATR